MIKLGQIGIGHNHGEGKMLSARKFPDMFDIVGYAEDDADWVAKRGGLSVYSELKRYETQELIEKCDALLVESDVWNLGKYADMCIKKGKHVHMDKPASGTLDEFSQILEEAKNKNLVFQMAYMYRYNPAVKKLFELINSGKIGEIYQIDAEMSTYHSAEYRKWLRNFKGGSMYIFGSHLIDLVILMLGEPKNVVSFIKNTCHDGVISDDNCLAVLEYEKALAKITNLSVEVNGWGMRRFAVMGSLGTVEIKPIENDTEMYYSDLGIATNAYQDKRIKIDIPVVPKNERYDEMMIEFYNCVVGNKKSPYSYEHDYAVQKTLYKAIGQNL